MKEEDRMAYLKDLPEAPSSLNVYFEKDGWNFQLTLRDNDEGKLFGRWQRAQEWLTAQGYRPKPVGKQPEADGGAQPQKFEQAFKAGWLKVEVRDGKHYYKVAGPEGAKFPKFPITVWPEVLQDAGFVPVEIPLEGISLEGMTAEYEKNAEGKITKVVKLTPTPVTPYD